MKRLITILAAVVLLAGCSGFQVKDDATSQAISYSAGKAGAIGIYKVAPKSAIVLETKWKEMMARNTAEVIPSAEIVLFFNESVLTLGTETKDPYGLIGDLSTLLLIFGAQYAQTGELVKLQDIPRPVAVYFGLGWHNGKLVAKNLK